MAQMGQTDVRVLARPEHCKTSSKLVASQGLNAPQSRLTRRLGDAAAARFLHACKAMTFSVASVLRRQAYRGRPLWRRRPSPPMITRTAIWAYKVGVDTLCRWFPARADATRLTG
jgi:hypothetical protein